MRKLHDRAPILFAFGWILLYCVFPVLLRLRSRSFGPLTAHLVLAAAVLAFLLTCRLAGYYGLTCWPKDRKRLLYLIPLWLLATGNLWGGASREALRSPDPAALGDMILAGFLEEVLFRGFLFRGLLKKLRPGPAAAASVLVFGLLHGANLPAGRDLLSAGLQILFALAMGFLFTMVYYKGGSLLPCILAHVLINVTALFAARGAAFSRTMSLAFIAAAVLISVFYGRYLSKLPQNE